MRSRPALVSPVCVCLLLAFSITTNGKDLKTAKPDREGVSSERLERIDNYMHAQVAAGVMVGGNGHDRPERQGRVQRDLGNAR